MEGVVSLPSPSSSYTRDLSTGSTGEDVRALQNLLINKSTGPAAEALKNNGSTGYFGPLTKAALIEFQGANNIQATGYFGPVTREVVGE